MTMTTVPPHPRAERSQTSLRGRAARRAMIPYCMLIAACLTINAVAAIVLLAQTPGAGEVLSFTLSATNVNIGIAVLIRQQYVHNLIFRIATGAPLHWPLRVRSILADIHNLGGIHVGCATAAVGWFVGFTGLVLTRPPAGPGPDVVPALQAVALLIAAALVSIAAMAVPRVRERRHEVFEVFHRYAGWITVVLFAALTGLTAASLRRSSRRRRRLVQQLDPRRCRPEHRDPLAAASPGPGRGSSSTLVPRAPGPLPRPRHPPPGRHVQPDLTHPAGRVPRVCRHSHAGV